uniref:Uncharacterized protein n=1 Tax=Arundo donax TaxID=35708 RepID=A0A0A9HDR3_ARUDO
MFQPFPNPAVGTCTESPRAASTAVSDSGYLLFLPNDAGCTPGYCTLVGTEAYALFEI